MSASSLVCASACWRLDWRDPCVMVPASWDANQQPGDWQILVRSIDDNLSYPRLFFFPTLWAVSINLHERPLRRADSDAEPKGK